MISDIEYLLDNFTGDAKELQALIGFIATGKYFGWRVLLFIYHKKTALKYATLLKIVIKDYFPEFTENSIRSSAYAFAVRAGSGPYWKIVSCESHLEAMRLLRYHIKPKYSAPIQDVA